MYDLVIRGGTVVDGTGAPRYQADVAIKGDKITCIAPHIEEKGAREIDAKGQVVSPGFIDYHSHSDNGILLGPDGYNYLEQGVTTEITGQCGTAPAPSYTGSLQEEKEILPPEKFAEVEKACDSYTSFIDYVSHMELGNNMAFYIGQGNVRGRVMGFDDSLPTKEQLEEMKAWVRQAMECGYLGMTTGLVYAPSVYAGEEELVELAKVVGEYGGSYASHIRGEADNVVESVEEAIRVGEKADIPVVISHLKVIGKQNEGLSEKVLQVIEDANARGVKVRADQYPYLAGSAPFISCIPPKFHVGGVEKLVENLKDPEFRKKVTYSIENEYQEFASNLVDAGFEGTLMAGCAKTPQYVGKTIAQIAEEEGKDPWDVCYDLLITNDGMAQGIYFNQNESDMMRIIAHPYVMGGSDWSNYQTHLDRDKVGGGHPRGTSTFITRLALLRDHGLQTLEQAVHSVTGLPAEMSGIDGIGCLKEGAHADICVFDYAALGADSDYLHPFRKNRGLSYVVVNGKVAVENGESNGVKNGRVLKKAPKA